MTSKATETPCPATTPKGIITWAERQWREGRTVTITSRSGKRSHAWSPDRADRSFRCGREPLRALADYILMESGHRMIRISGNWTFASRETARNVAKPLIIEARRNGGMPSVTVAGRPLRLRLDLGGHSPSGVEWGYAGSGPAQLALALLALVADDETAIEYHQQFKLGVIAGLPERGWRTTTDMIADWVSRARWTYSPYEPLPMDIEPLDGNGKPDR